MIQSDIRTGCGVSRWMMVLAMAVGGCGSPSAANIELRKQNQTLQAQVDQLTAQHGRDVETLAACRLSHPTVPMLPPDRLDQLVTTHGLSFGKLTGGDNPDSTQNFDSQLKVFVVPIDDDGTPIKAAGAFKVEAFDLGDPSKPLIGTWSFNPATTRGFFYSQFAMYTYVLSCPFTKLPAHSNLTVRVTFDDSLTGGKFINQVEAKVRLVPSSH